MNAPTLISARRGLACAMAALGLVAGITWLVFAIGRADAALPFSGQVVGGTLFVTGSAGNDDIVVRLQAGAPGVLEIDFNNDGIAELAFVRATFSAINVNAGGGADTARISDSNGQFSTTQPTTLDGGGGNDTLFGASGAETLIGNGGNDTVDGNLGTDVVLLGGGTDTAVWDPGDASDLIEGQSGKDTLRFNGSNASEVLDVSANGPRVRLFRNVANIVMDLNEIETIGLNTLGGADGVTINDLTGTAARNVNVDLAAFGGGGDAQADQVVVNGTAGGDVVSIVAQGSAAVVEGLTVEPAVTGGEPTMDELIVNTGGGADAIKGSPAVGAVIKAVIDGGADTDTASATGTAGSDTFQMIANGTRARIADGGAGFFEVATAETTKVSGLGGNDNFSATGNLAAILPSLVFDGGSGNDTILGGNGAELLLGGAGNDFVDGNQGDDLVLLGVGNDTAQWDPGDGSDTIEGDAGTDALAFNGSNASEMIDISANGNRVRFFRNVANILLDLNGLETVGFNALGGADVVTVNDLSGTSARTVPIDLRTFGAGDTQPDQVNVIGTAGADALELVGTGPAASVKGLAATPIVMGGEIGLDVLAIDGGAGNDTIEVVPGSALLDLVPDGGADVDTVFTDGTNGADTFQVVANGARARVVNTSGAYFEVGPVENMRVNGLNGDDSFAATGNLAGILPSMMFDGGGNNDTILGGNGPDVLIGGSGNDFVDGNQGDDLVLLGVGNDTAQWDPGDGSDTIEGDAGTDALAFNGSNASEMIDISANGNRVRFFRNVANILLDLNGLETVGFKALGGADVVGVGDLTGTSVRTVTVDLSPVGGGGDAQPDQVVVNGTNGVDNIKVSGTGTSSKVEGLTAKVNVTGSEAANDRLDIQTLNGIDNVASTGLAPGVIQLFVDGVFVS